MPTEEKKPIRIPVTITVEDNQKLLDLRRELEKRNNKQISIAETIRQIIRTAKL